MRATTVAAVTVRWRRGVAIAALVFSCGIAALHGQTALSPEEQDKALAAIREYALNYTKNLPDFTCIRMTQQSTAFKNQVRYRSGGSSHPWINIVEEELTVSGKREIYRTLKVDNDIPENLAKPPPDQIFRRISVREFGWSLDRIFGAETGTRFHWSRSSKLRGRSVTVFSFDVPRAHGAQVYDRLAKQDLLVGYQGLVYADVQSDTVLRVEIRSSDFPPESELTGMELTFDYKAVKLAEREFVLPYRFSMDLHSRIYPGMHYLAEESSVTADYQKYRVYSAQSAVVFGEANSQDDVRSAVTFGEIIPPEKK
jgi:hypothetical protein